MAELEEKLVQEEVERRTNELIEERVQEVMNSESVQQSLHARLVDERKVLEEQVWRPCKQIHLWSFEQVLLKAASHLTVEMPVGILSQEMGQPYLVD